MADTPRNPIFDAASGGDPLGKDTIARASELKRIAALKIALPAMLERTRAKPRIEQFLPYLLIRSFAGDMGARPYPPYSSASVPVASPFESPDIWIAAGDPSSTPALPQNGGTVVTSGGLATVYAHVWNLGRAPVIGATVQFHHAKNYGLWAIPLVPTVGNQFAFSETDLQLIGMAKVAPRSSFECHKLVKCPTAWSLPVFSGTQLLIYGMLVVRMSGIGDPLGDDPFSPNINRHVAMRQVPVAGV
jgi:hypothetical protein